jgi:Raf kinase inhibitor-like YbhB/YbcL family protein
VRFRQAFALVVAVLVLVAVPGCGSSIGTTSGSGTSTTTGTKEGGSMFTISSPAFESGGLIPPRYATTRIPGGSNLSIPYEWRNAPAGTRSFALVLIDRAPVARNWVHWIVYDIPATATGLQEGASPSALPAGAKELTNTFGSSGYGGLQPPRGTGRHPYETTLYALDVSTLALGPTADLSALQRAMQGHVLGTATMTGLMGQ